jgi:diketogulonate reductase-like aldo/keto reductase
LEEKESPSIKKAIDDLLETTIIKEISKRNNKDFAQKLVIWLVRYILIISSMNESLNIDLEEVLLNLHGKNFKKILEITEQTFNKMKKDEENYNKYIW